MQLLATTTLFTILYSHVQASVPAAWRDRSIYQVMVDRFERPDGDHSAKCDPTARVACGGTWAGLAKKLDYISSLGFNAIWINPIFKQIDFDNLYGQPYHGYWVQDFTKLNDNFGTKEDLINLISEVHKRDMFIAVEMVPNNMAGHPITYGKTTTAQLNLTGYAPFDSPANFHEPCKIDYTNDAQIDDKSVTECWLGDEALPLMDLKTEDPDVAAKLRDIASKTVKDFGFDAITIASAKHIRKDFWKSYADAAGVFSLGEVVATDPAQACAYQNNALDGVLNYPLFVSLQATFSSVDQKFDTLVSQLSTIRTACADSTLLGTFFETQGSDRWRAKTSDEGLLSNVATFTLLSDGLPIFAYGFEQGFAGKAEGELNREAIWHSDFKQESPAFKQIQLLNKFRYQLIVADPDWNTAKQIVISTADHWIATLKDKLLVVYTNYGAESGVVPILFKTPFAPGTILNELFSNTNITVAEDGSVTTALLHGQPLVYLPTDPENTHLSEQCGPGLSDFDPSHKYGNGPNSTDPHHDGPGYKPKVGTKNGQPPKNDPNGAPGLKLSLATISVAALFSIAFWL